MSFPTGKVKSVSVGEDALTVELIDGRVISAPLIWYPTLIQATPKQLKNWKTCGAGSGVHWPLLDYRLSVEGILRGAREAESVARNSLAKA
jgi:hypothetical protein